MKKIRIVLLSMLVLAGVMLFGNDTCMANEAVATPLNDVTVSTAEDLAKYLSDYNCETIRLACDITVKGEMWVKGVKRLRGNGHTLFRGNTNELMISVADQAHFYVDGLTITGNNLKGNWGLIRVCKQGYLELAGDVRIWDVRSVYGGAGINNSGTVVTSAAMHHCFSDRNGGAICNNENASLTIKGGEYKYNQAYDGGAIYETPNSYFTIDGGLFESNDCTHNGEALYLTGTTIKGNVTVEYDNDAYVAAENVLNLSGLTDGVMYITMFTDKLGTIISANGVQGEHLVQYSNNYKFNRTVQRYGDFLIIGCWIRVRYDGYSTPSSKYEYIRWGTVITNPPTLSRTGYRLSDWYYMSNGQKQYLGWHHEVREDADIICYPEWVALSYKLSFDSNGGASANGTVNVTYDQPIASLPTPKREGYVFTGWFDSKTGGKQYKTGEISKFTQNTTLYAQWTPVQVQVSLDAMGGTVSQQKLTVYYSQKFGKLPVPTKTGYTFVGWSMDKENKAPVTNQTIVSNANAFTLYAIWKANNYTVSFNANGGAVTTSSKVVAYQNAYGTLPVPTRKGYSFGGWYTNQSFSNKITEQTKMQTANNHTLYAKWTVNKYKLRFDANGGWSPASEQVVVYDTNVGNLPTPSRDGYRFAGWFTEKNGGTQYVASTKMQENKDVTLYARWDEDWITGISVSGVGSVYYVYQSINTGNLKVEATYRFGRKEQITSGYEITYNNRNSGKTDVVITYKGKECRTSCYFYDYWTLRGTITAKSTINLYPNEKSTIGIKNLPYVRGCVSFESMNRSIATVDRNGRVTAKKAGRLNIKVSFKVNGKKVDVYQKVNVKKPEIKVTWKRTKKGLQFYAKTKGCGKVTWTSSNKKVGTIDKKKGKFVGKKKGKTYIYASASGVKKKIKVVVKNGMFECY